MIMSFGKHRGEDITNVPTDYLDWLLGETQDPYLRDDLLEELRKRPEWVNDEEAGTITHEDIDMCPKCVEELDDKGWCKVCQTFPLKS